MSKVTATFLLYLLVFSVRSDTTLAQNGEDTSAVRHGLGVVLDDKDYDRFPLKPTFRSIRKDESGAFSLKKYAPFAGDQGVRNTSVGWALSYAARTVLEAIRLEWDDRDYITRHAYSPSFLYNQIILEQSESDSSCSQGVPVTEGLRRLKKVGTVKMTDFPVNCSMMPDSEEMRTAYDHRIFEYSRLFERDQDNKISKIKKSIRERKPVVVVINVPQSFYEADGISDWVPSDFEKPGQDWHVLTVVGYDDHRNGGSFELMNSWGRFWGNDGFVWMRYSDVEDVVRYAFDVHIANKKQSSRFQGSAGIVLRTSDVLDTHDIGDGLFRAVEPLHSGTILKVRARTVGPTYLYILSGDDRHPVNLLFPDAEKRESAFLSFEEISVFESIPLQLDPYPGTDYLSAVLSLHELDVDAMLEALSTLPGNLHERLQAKFSDSRIDSRFIRKSASGLIDFSSAAADKTTALISFEIAHLGPSDQSAASASDDESVLLATSPPLSDAPAASFEIGSEIKVVGQFMEVDPSAAIYINGQVVNVSPTGRFSIFASVIDPEGLLVIEFKDSKGTQRMLRRYLTAENQDRR